MGKLTKREQIIVAIAIRDALAGQHVLIITPSRSLESACFDFVVSAVDEAVVVYRADARFVTARKGELRFVPVRNMRDLERLRGRDAVRLVCLRVQRRFTDLLRPWFEGRGATMSIH